MRFGKTVGELDQLFGVVGSFGKKGRALTPGADMVNLGKRRAGYAAGGVVASGIISGGVRSSGRHGLQTRSSAPPPSNPYGY